MMVHSHGNGPPGTSTFNIEPAAVEEESEESPEVLDSLPLGAMFFGDPEHLTSSFPWPIEEWTKHYPYWNEPNILAWENPGNCFVMVADAILTQGSPYPGNELFNGTGLWPELRFHVYQVSRAPVYAVDDWLTGNKLKVNQWALEDPEFDVRNWYAMQQAQALGLTWNIEPTQIMGDALGIIATELLVDGIASSYPSVIPWLDPNERPVSK